MKRKNSGITLIEILTVITIIVVLAGLMIPAMTMARKAANQTKQHAEINAIELALTSFKNDYGDYPPSGNGGSPCPVAANDYSGAQKLAEALCGWDLLGFDPCSVFRSDGYDCSNTPLYSQQFSTPPSPSNLANLQTRKGPYLDMTSINVFKLQDVFSSGNIGQLANTYVLCDVFGVRNVNTTAGKSVKAGMPILYFKANPALKYYDATTGCSSDSDCATRIYDFYDNKYLIDLGKLTPDGTPITTSQSSYTPTLDPSNNDLAFYKFINDTRVPLPSGWPYNPDSYILISAGPDGEYGTSDDICNF